MSNKDWLVELKQLADELEREYLTPEPPKLTLLQGRQDRIPAERPPLTLIRGGRDA